MNPNDPPPPHDDRPLFEEAVQGLLRGDFSRLEPLFDDHPSPDRHQCRIVEWFEKGNFAAEPKALAEAFTCACLLGRTGVADFLALMGVDPAAGDGMGLNGFHWAANRGRLDTVNLIIERGASTETKNMYGGTVLGTAAWSAINEPRDDHIPIIEALIAAGASLEGAGYPTGNERIDALLRSHERDGASEER